MLSKEIILRFNPSEPEQKPIRFIENLDSEYVKYAEVKPEFYRIENDKQVIDIVHENFKLRQRNKELEEANKELIRVKALVESRDEGLLRLRSICRLDSYEAFKVAMEWFKTKYGGLTEEEHLWVRA